LIGRGGQVLGRINQADLKKTAYYLKRNGLKRTWYAVRERMEEKKQSPYEWIPPGEKELEAQRTHCLTSCFSVTFTILTPAYRTKETHLMEMLESLRRQTYPRWELILADATEDDSVERVVRTVEDSRIRYLRLQENGGIAQNTNQALTYAVGDYVGLLDHDDVLTENALYEMAVQIEQRKQQGAELQMLYSDEDKCNGDRTEYFEPNRKEDFNLDLLLSNNYICHFLVMKRELIRKLCLRTEYEGAQDYDLVLRAAAELKEREREIVHVPRVLYHWRCHSASTAENPQSKLYAYEAGRRAIQDFVDREGWQAKVVETPHVGFYALQYKGSLFDSRKEIGAVGGRVLRKGRVISGRLTEEGEALYGNLPVGYSGYLHRASLSQEAVAVDIRNLMVRPECQGIFRQITGVVYRTVPGKEIFDCSLLEKNVDFVQLSLKLCKAFREAGYRILYLPTGKELKG